MNKNIYRTYLLILQDKRENLNIEDLKYLPRREVVVEELENNLYKEIYTGIVFPSIDIDDIEPYYLETAYVISPNKINDLLSDTIDGIKYIESYLGKKSIDKKHFNKDLNSFISDYSNLDENEINAIKKRFDYVKSGIKTLKK